MPLIASVLRNNYIQLLFQVTTELQCIPEKESDGFQELMESNRRLKNQVISLQGNVKEKKNKLKRLKRRSN